MMYLVDSDWTVDFLKGRPQAKTVLESLYADGLAVSIITGISRPVARRFASMRGMLRSRGDLIPQPDLVIAATAIEHHLTLLTRNTRHFARIPGLQLYQ